jgi:ribosomal-protein-alanine N-acetyltransferase
MQNARATAGDRLFCQESTASMPGRCRNPLTPVGPADGLRVAPADAGDLAALTALDRACFGQRAWAASHWRELLATVGVQVTLVRGADGPVAASVLLPDPPRAHLASLAVLPGWRRQGLARFLLGEAVARSAAAGARWLLLEVDADNADALRLYRRAGLVATRRFREDGRERLEMVRRIGGRRARGALAMMPPA